MITRRQATQTLIALSALPHVHTEMNWERQEAKAENRICNSLLMTGFQNDDPDF